LRLREAVFATLLGLGLLALPAASVGVEANATAPASESSVVEAISSAAAKAARPPLIPARIFASEPPFSGMEMSPAGTQLVATTTVQGKVDLLIYDLTSGRSRLLPLPPNTELESYQWAGEKRILFSVGWTVPLARRRGLQPPPVCVRPRAAQVAIHR
jgi:hypothetical protein